jgi:hypothetical protein
MDEHSTGKVIPPAEFVIETIREEAEQITRQRLTDKILREAGLDEQIEKAMQVIDLPVVENVQADMLKFFADNPTEPWRTRAGEIAHLIASNDNEPQQQVS